MSKFALVTDSTAYVPTELIQKHNISVVPLILVWGDEMFEDGVDILPKEFYTRLKTAKVMPSTSQATPAKMQAIFQSLVDQGMDVLGMFISSKLSGTMQSAMQAKDMMGSAGEKVTLVDSQCTSMALGFQVLAAARAMDAGASLQECAAIAE